MTRVWSVWISCFAATVWLLAAISTARGRLKKMLFGILVFADSFLLVSTLYCNDQMVRASHSFNLRLYEWTVIAELVAILIVICALIKFDRHRLIAAAVVVAVGLHFLGLWAASGVEHFITLAVLLSVSGCAALVAGPVVEHRLSVTNGSLFLAGLGASASFWIVCLATLWSMH